MRALLPMMMELYSQESPWSIYKIDSAIICREGTLRSPSIRLTLSNSSPVRSGGRGFSLNQTRARCSPSGAPWRPLSVTRTWRISPHRWHTEAVGLSIHPLSPWYRTYRATAKSTSRIARTIQMLTRIRAGLPPFSPPESGSLPGGPTCASTSRVPPFDEYRSGIDPINELEVGEDLPRCEPFDFLLTQAVEPIKKRTLLGGQLRRLFGARHGDWVMLLQRSVFPRCLPASTMRARFKLVATKEHDEFGKTLVGEETWELDLGQQSWQ